MMSVSGEIIPQKFNWNLASLILIAVYLLLAFSRTSLFPVYLDIYYHLGVMQGFDLAGGIVTWDFWEFAPQGRPHFYPPLLHILMLGFYKLGLSKVRIAISFSFIIFPLFIFILWQITKKIFNPRLAFFVLLTSLVSYSLFLGLTNTLAATLALIILLTLFFSIEKNKKISTIILTALLFYTHYAISIMGVLTVVIYSFLRKENFKEKAYLILFGIILALPWLVHFVYNFGYLTRIIYHDLGLEINIILLILSMLGICLCLRLGRAHLFFISLLLIALMGTVKHPYRLFNTQPAIAMLFASAVVIERFFAWLDSKKLIRTAVLVIFFIFSFNLFSFSIVLSPPTKTRLICDSLFWNLLLFPKQDPALHNFRDVSFYRRYGKEFKKIIDIVNDYTEKGDIIYSNFSYQAGLFSAFTERANATMSPYTLKRGLPQERYIKNAKLILWLKNPEGGMEEELARFVEDMSLEKVVETEMFYVYRNPLVDFKMKIVHPVMPTAVAFLLLFCALSLVAWDLLKP